MKPLLFFDQDGLLSQFAAGALKFHGKHLDPMAVRWDFPQQIGFAGTWVAEFWDPLRYDFWRNLERHEDGFEVLRWAEGAFGADNVVFLTSPCDSPGCVDGKLDWLDAHVGPKTRRRTLVGPPKHTIAGPTKVLLDDYAGNTDKFLAHGGRAVLAPRPWNSRISECRPDGSFDPAAVIAELERHLTEITAGANQCPACGCASRSPGR